MVVNFILFCFLILLTYVYINHYAEVTATACALRQIWSGSCRLSCRQSQYSDLSGLSGLEGTDSPSTSQPKQPCVCETCPCAAVDKVLKICRPVTSAYSQFIELISNYTYSAAQVVSECNEYFSRVADCGTSCQRQAQLTTTQQLDSSQNINFGLQEKKAEEKKPEGKLKAMKSLILRRKSIATESRPASVDEGNESKEPREPKKRSLSVVSRRESEEEVRSISGKSCSKCIEKGYTCMKNCPRANRQ